MTEISHVQYVNVKQFLVSNDSEYDELWLIYAAHYKTVISLMLLFLRLGYFILLLNIYEIRYRNVLIPNSYLKCHFSFSITHYCKLSAVFVSSHKWLNWVIMLIVRSTEKVSSRLQCLYFQIQWVEV